MMIKRIKNIFLELEFIKFVIIGFINTFNHNVIYLLLIYFNVYYVIANLFAFIISMTISFFLNSYITFKVKPTWQRFLLFPLSNLPTLFFQTIGIYLVVEIGGLPKEYGALVLSLLSIPFTFIIMRYIFKYNDKKK
ncbi:MAG: GtrA family protein [Bacilli bacterium]|nr:GtrA family protein [Bacilli bacterium]